MWISRVKLSDVGSVNGGEDPYWAAQLAIWQGFRPPKDLLRFVDNILEYGLGIHPRSVWEAGLWSGKYLRDDPIQPMDSRSHVPVGLPWL